MQNISDEIVECNFSDEYKWLSWILKKQVHWKCRLLMGLFKYLDQIINNNIIVKLIWSNIYVCISSGNKSVQNYEGVKQNGFQMQQNWDNSVIAEAQLSVDSIHKNSPPNKQSLLHYGAVREGPQSHQGKRSDGGNHRGNHSFII